MNRFSIPSVIIGISSLLFFLVIFNLFQNESVYQKTLGKISQNYERVGTWNDYKINKVSKPYLNFESIHFQRWDAAIYMSIRDHYYTAEGSYNQVRGAFFPLFPMVWKLSNTGTLGISLINYLLFVLSIGLLIQYLFKEKTKEKLFLFAILISFPSTIVHYVPYSESIFLLIMTGMIIGLVRKNKALYFTFALLLATVRPAAVFILLALLAAELINFLANRDFKQFIRESFYKAVPFVLGFIASLGFQYYFTKSWTTVLDAQKFWKTDSFSFPDRIVDWSVEGFSLNTFSVCFICIPAVFFILMSLYKSIQKQASQSHEDKLHNYLLNLAAIYFVGIMSYRMLTNGGSLNSSFRYIIGSPLFYITVIILVNKLMKNKFKYTFALLLPITILFLTLFATDYGGDRWNFSFAGAYLSVISCLLIQFGPRLKDKLRLVFTGTLVIVNLIWTSYLLNMFMSDGWIFL